MWDENAEFLLKTNYNYYPNKTLATLFGVSESAIRSKASKLELKKEPGYTLPAWNKGKRGYQIAWNRGISNYQFRGPGNPQWKGGKYIDTQGYVRISVGKKRPMTEHRFVMEAHLGRKLKKTEHVHHIDGDKTNNKIENLMLLSNSEHRRIHAKKNRGDL